MDKKKNSESFLFLTLVGVAATVIGGLFLWGISEGIKEAWKNDFLDIPITFKTWRQNGGLDNFQHNAYYGLLIIVFSLLALVLFEINAQRKERKKTQETKEPPQKQLANVPQESFLNYSEDVIGNVLWRWEYNGNEPVNLKGFCNYEGTALRYETHQVTQLDYTSRAMTGLKCPACHTWHSAVRGGMPDVERVALLEIKHRIHTKQYLRKYRLPL